MRLSILILHIVMDLSAETLMKTPVCAGLLSRIVPLRRQMAAEPGSGVAPLKLLIMSATLRVEDFIGNPTLFPAPPPVVHVPARQYPVTVHFARRTELHDYVGAAYAKVDALLQAHAGNKFKFSLLHAPVSHFRLRQCSLYSLHMQIVLLPLSMQSTCRVESCPSTYSLYVAKGMCMT